MINPILSRLNITYRLPALAVIVLLFLVGMWTISSADTEQATFTYSIDRSAVPFVNHTELTLLIVVGDSQSITLTDGTQPVSYIVQPESQEIMVTTTANSLDLTLAGYSTTTNLGNVRKAPLKDNKPWAYSHSFDDNFNLEPQLQILERLGVPATVYLVGDWIKDFDQGDWEIDPNRLIQLINQGWSVGNHTWTHEESCSIFETESQRRESLDQTSDWLHQLISRSNRPNYRITSFAVPCGDADRSAAYNTLLNEMERNGETLIQFSEAGWNSPTIYLEVSDSFDFDRLIPRDGRIDGENADGVTIRGQFDEMSDYAARTPGLALWYNTFSHGNLFGFNTETFDETMTYLVDTYGENGTNEAWIAPADVIYSYLLVREGSVVTISPAFEPTFNLFIPFVNQEASSR